MSASGNLSPIPGRLPVVCGKAARTLFTLTLNGEPLAKMVPIKHRQAVPGEEVLAIFATAPVIDGDELRSDLDAAVEQDIRDPYEGTGL